MPIRSIEDDLHGLCRQVGISEHLSILERAWEAEMGGWAGMARICALDHQSLVVEATSSPALQEITLRRRELVRRLNRYFKHPFLRDLTVRMTSDGSHD